MSDPSNGERRKRIDWNALTIPMTEKKSELVVNVSNPKKNVDWESLTVSFDSNDVEIPETTAPKKRVVWTSLTANPDEKS